MEWLPTHRINLTSASGGAKEWLVMLCKDPYSADFLVGLTENEWTKAQVPRWRYEKSSKKWRWMGPSTSDWENVKVQVEEVTSEHQPSTLRFAKPDHRRNT